MLTKLAYSYQYNNDYNYTTQSSKIQSNCIAINVKYNHYHNYISTQTKKLTISNMAGFHPVTAMTKILQISHC